MENSLSVIQGPPGTGKTQTILNIIANILISGKTVQIVSNNNSATENVLEKLSDPKYNIGFIIAPLEKSENKTKFINTQNGKYPEDLASWGIGKSSLSFQLQNVLSGEDTLLTRYSMRIDIPSYIIVDYICTNYDTLESIIRSIVIKLDEQVETFKSKYTAKKMEFELSLFSCFKTKMEFESEQQEEQNSLINSFIDVVEKICETYVEPHINIAIDELIKLIKNIIYHIFSRLYLRP